MSEAERGLFLRLLDRSESMQFRSFVAVGTVQVHSFAQRRGYGISV